MPEALFSKRPFAAGGKGDFSRADLRMAISAVRRWGVGDQTRSEFLQEVIRICRESPEDKTRLLAIKLAVEMDKVDAKREENAIQQKHHEVLEATAVIRAAMEAPGMRDQLAKLSDHICSPIPIEAQKEIDDTLTAETDQVMEAMKRLDVGHINGNGKK